MRRGEMGCDLSVAGADDYLLASDAACTYAALTVSRAERLTKAGAKRVGDFVRRVLRSSDN